MSYNPAVDKPKTVEEWHACVDFYLARADEKAAADPKYQKQARAQIEATFACYYPRKEPLMPI